MPAAVRLGPGAERDVARLVNQLEKFDKDVNKELQSEIRKAARQVVAKAKSYPNAQSNVLSGWGRWIDAGVQPRSTAGRDLSYSNNYKIVTNNYRAKGRLSSFGYDAIASNAGAGVFQFVGSLGVGPGMLSGGMATFRRNVVNKFGPVPRGAGKAMPRVLSWAYYKTIPQVHKDIERAIDAAMRKVGK